MRWRWTSRGAASGDLEDAAPVPTQATVRSFGEASTDLAVEAVPLPVLHGDVAGEGVQQVDVALGVVHGLPVVLLDLDHLEEAAGFDVVTVVVQLLRSWQYGVRRERLADLVVDLLQLREEAIAAVGDHMARSPQREVAVRLQH